MAPGQRIVLSEMPKGVPSMSSEPSRAGAIARACSYVDDGRFEADLARRVAIRTESQALPASLPELERYAPAQRA